MNRIWEIAGGLSAALLLLIFDGTVYGFGGVLNEKDRHSLSTFQP
jgi:hypothetical protein